MTKKYYGILDRIKVAQSVQEVNQLLSEVLSYKYAKPRTISKAERLVHIRLHELSLKLGGNK